MAGLHILDGKGGHKAFPELLKLMDSALGDETMKDD